MRGGAADGLSIRGALWITSAAAVLTAALGAPVLISPTTRIVGNEFVGPHHDPFTVILQFARPPRLTLYTQPVTDFAGAAVAQLTGAVAAYNLIVLASFPLAALCAFLFVRRLTSSGAAAAIASFVFAFSAFHIAHAAYHPHIAQVQWIPLYLLALWVCLERFTASRAAGLAGAAVLVVLSNFYGGFIAAVMTPFVAGAFLLGVPRKQRGAAASDVRPTAVVLLLVALAGVLYAWTVGPQIITNAASLAVPREDLARYGAAWWAYFVPAVVHPLTGVWGSAIMARAGITTGLLEQQVTLGWSVMILAFVAVWRRRSADPALARTVPALLVVACAAFVFSLAPWQRIAGLPIPAPAALLHELAPMFRAYARFAVVVSLAVAALAGIGFAHLIASQGRWARAAGWALVVLVCAESPALSLREWRHVLPTEGHRWLATLPPEARIMYLTRATPAGHSIAPLVGRNISFLPAESLDIRDPDLARMLHAWGFTHALYHRPSTVARWLEAHPPDGLRMAGRFADSAVVEVLPARPRLTMVWDGFYPREDSAAGSWRWMGDSGTWTVTNRETLPVWIALDVEAESLGFDHEVDVLVDGQPLASVTIRRDRRWYRVPPFMLRPGDTGLTFRPKAPPVTADSILHNGDSRALSIALWKWKWTWITGPPA